jgi:hypothetical protein
VKPCCASSAAYNPFFAAQPGCNGLHMEPNISRSPLAVVAAMPSAKRISFSPRPSRRPAAAARAEHAGGARDVPADVVVARVYRVADPALDFDADDERIHEGGSWNGLVLRQRHDRGRHGARRMDHGAQVRVVEVEGVRRHAVDQRGVEDVEPVAAAQDVACRAPANGATAASARSTVG